MKHVLAAVELFILKLKIIISEKCMEHLQVAKF